MWEKFRLGVYHAWNQYPSRLTRVSGERYASVGIDLGKGEGVMIEIGNIIFSALLLAILSLAAVKGSTWVANLLFAI
jgi:hypothetical protein